MATREITPSPMEVWMTLEHIGRRIAEARKERRMTRRDLAAKLGVGSQVIAHIEQGRETVQIRHYARAVWLFELRGVQLVSYLTPDPSGET